MRTLALRFDSMPYRSPLAQPPMHRLPLRLSALLLATFHHVGAQTAPVRKAPLADPIPADSLPAYVRTTAPTDPVIRRIVDEGTNRSALTQLASALFDSIGPRLTASPNMTRGQNWLLATYARWGIAARKEQYGTFPSWRRGATYASLVAPRQKDLDATMVSWSGGTGGAWIDGDVMPIAAYNTIEEFTAWLGTVRGKVVLASPPKITCRNPTQVAEFATDASRSALDSAQRQIDATYNGLTQRVRDFYDDVKAAGAIAVFESEPSIHPGITRVFGSPRNASIPTLSIGCEDYAMLFRLATNRQSPHVRLSTDAESLGDQPVFNVIGEIKGTKKPNEYVVLSAHFDSWEGHSGATDNGTGTLTMLEAMRILKTAYPNPARTIVVGHWSGEEQGILGSNGFAQAHPEIVAGLQYTFNQDNGTGRIITMGPTILPQNGPRLANYLAAMPRELTQYIRLQPGMTMYSSGSDHVPFLCRGAPALNLNALQWDYSYTTWHTNRDALDKVMMDDLRGNAMIVAMLAYEASEDPERTSREPIAGINPNASRCPAAR